MSAACWVLVRTGFESRWGLHFSGSSGMVPVVYRSSHAYSLIAYRRTKVNLHNLPLALHVIIDRSARGWGIGLAYWSNCLKGSLVAGLNYKG